MKGERSKSMSSENDNAKGGSKEMKAEGREDRNGKKAEGREDRSNMKAEGREDRNGMKAEGREDRNGMKPKAATARRARRSDRPAPVRSFRPNSAPRSPA